MLRDAVEAPNSSEDDPSRLSHVRKLIPGGGGGVGLPGGHQGVRQTNGAARVGWHARPGNSSGGAGYDQIRANALAYRTSIVHKTS